MAKNYKVEAKIQAQKAKTADQYKTQANELQGRLSDMAKNSKRYREDYNTLVQESDAALAAQIQEYEQLRRDKIKVEAKLNRVNHQLRQENAELLTAYKTERKRWRVFGCTILLAAMYETGSFLIGL